jgi:hypothetical protein
MIFGPFLSNFPGQKRELSLVFKMFEDFKRERLNVNRKPSEVVRLNEVVLVVTEILGATGSAPGPTKSSSPCIRIVENCSSSQGDMVMTAEGGFPNGRGGCAECSYKR